MFRKLMKPIRAARSYHQLPPGAKSAQVNDRSGLPFKDPGIKRAVGECAAWIARAQDNSLSHDGGVASGFSLISGWSTSYPETTGYIVPTMLAYAKLKGDEAVRHRARQMLDWLVSIQSPEGSFQGGVIGASPVIPVTFNTGQILLGLASGVREFGEQYRAPMCRAADWLVATQDHYGCWRSHPSPFAAPGEKVYDTHVAWGLLEAARIEPSKPYTGAALANIRWALRLQHDNGWFDKCCLSEPARPLTHTLGYALRGLIEAYRFAKDRALLEACRRTADGLLTAIGEDGFLPGRLRSNWRGAVHWACLTGSVQIAHCWLMLYQDTGDVRYRDAAHAANRYVRRSMKVSGPPETRGSIKGSFPVDGGYGPYQYLSWACKFLVDSNLLENALRESQE